MTEEIDKMYGAGAKDFAIRLINELAPTTRRDEWWETDGPYEIIAVAMERAAERRTMTDEKMTPMTLIERLQNPQWVTGVNFTPPSLDVERTRKDMEEAADEICRLRAAGADLYDALLTLADFDHDHDGVDPADYRMALQRAREALDKASP